MQKEVRKSVYSNPLVITGFILIFVGLLAIIVTTHITLSKLSNLDLTQLSAWKELASNTIFFTWTNVVFVFAILLGILLIDWDLMRKKV